LKPSFIMENLLKEENPQPPVTGSGPQLIVTADGSSSLYLPDLDETYHSRHGAVQESEHVFIARGFDAVQPGPHPIHLLEVGFGTGLNAWLTLLAARQKQRYVHYTGLEPHPLSEAVWRQLRFTDQPSQPDEFTALHLAAWNAAQPVDPLFILEKRDITLAALTDQSAFDLVYYDAFGPRAQPAMWTPEVFAALHRAMKPGAVLVTYCAKGQVRRDLTEAGFSVERLEGPPGKREMLRARKTD
jgi:tRNA U34 5-methylaminomethyl-2-thiouridine-forming methyltransferase MnmC